MAFADLSLAAALWRGRGLRWLAACADLPPELSLTCQPMQAAAQKAARPANGAKQPGAGVRHNAVRDAVQEQRPAEAKRQPAKPAADTDARWRPRAPDALPEAWRSRLSATRPGLVAWTYWGLAQDIAAAAGNAVQTEAEVQPRSQRRAFLARLLRDLAHPAGTHTFWPSCQPAKADAESEAQDLFAADAEAFWSGLVHLGCRAVIVMGSAAARALALPDSARPFGLLRWRGHVVLVLAEVDALAEDAAQYSSILAFIRRGLGALPRPTR